MRLVFPEPVGNRAHEADAVELPGMTLRVVAVEPLPEDREAWRARVAGAGKAHEVAHTPTGWPLAIVEGDRDVIGFYELFDRGIVVALTATGDHFDRVRARELLQGADLDRTPREVVALAELWPEP